MQAFLTKNLRSPQIDLEMHYTTDGWKTSRVLKSTDVPSPYINGYFYLPFVEADVNNPTGPVKMIGLANDRIFGFQVYTDLDVFYLLGYNPAAGTSWTAALDYLTKRGPAGGTNFTYDGNDLFDLPGHYNGRFKLWGIYDKGQDILGGFRVGEPHPLWRGRLFWRHMEDFPEGFQLQTQVSLLSDKNLLEQYYKPEFDQELNQETFVNLLYRRGVLGGSLLVEPHIRSWVTETAWLPKAEGRVIGWSFLDLFTYDARVSAGYADLRRPSK